MEKIKKGGISKVLFQAMNYSLFNGGKRIRPILCLACFDAIKDRNFQLNLRLYQEILPFACGLEFIHTFSLIQDDLPSMDNDDLRRGKPTLHKKYGEAVALLAADALFAQAYKLFAQASIDSEIKVMAINELADICGVEGLANGQFLDITKRDKQISSILQNLINEQKTAKMISGSMKIGAIVALGSDKIIKQIEKAGKYLGLLFQITDDLLDKESLKYKNYRQMINKYVEITHTIFTKLGKRFNPFIEFTNYLISRQK
ncbi:MAG: polyprenyl synthetase family protein [candidate division WOR-3 bacterium]